MVAGLLLAFALLAPAGAAAAPGADPSTPAPAAASAGTAQRDCAASNSDPNARQIVICAPRSQGYRINPDLMEAKRQKRSGGRPTSPHETFADHSCATIGPMGCRGGPTINLIAAATTLATMAARLSKGEEIGSMFKTTPEPTEYQLYLAAKQRREAKEADAAAAAKAKAAPPAPAAAPPAAAPPR